MFTCELQHVYTTDQKDKMKIERNKKEKKETRKWRQVREKIGEWGGEEESARNRKRDKFKE